MEREKYLALEPRHADGNRPAEPAKDCGVAPPGKRTLVELAAELMDAAGDGPVHVPVLGSSALDELRRRGLHEVLAALGAVRGGRGLIQAAITAATQATRAVMPSLTGRSTPPDPIGHAMWRVAERRAATIYRLAVGGESRVEDPAIEAALQQIGGGQPLPDRVREGMERELGVSLERVRIHTDAVAAEAARAICAEAFTVGEDIFFAEHAFAPETDRGRRLLGHELAHVLQAWQRRTATSGHGIQISAPQDHLEREADAIAERLGDAGQARRGPTAAPVPPRPLLAPATVAPSGPGNATLLRSPAGGAPTSFPPEAQRFLQVVQARYQLYTDQLLAAYPNHRAYVGTVADELTKRDLKFALGVDFSSSTVRLSRTNRTNADASALDGKILIEFALTRSTHGTPNEPGDLKTQEMGRVGRRGKTAAVIAGSGDTRPEGQNYWYRSSASFSPAERLRLRNMADRVAALPSNPLIARVLADQYQQKGLKVLPSPPRSRIRGPKGAAVMNAAAAAAQAGAQALNMAAVRHRMNGAWEEKQGLIGEWQLSDIKLGVLVTFVTQTPRICAEMCPVTFARIDLSQAPTEQAARTKFDAQARLLPGDIDEHYQHLWLPAIATLIPFDASSGAEE